MNGNGNVTNMEEENSPLMRKTDGFKLEVPNSVKDAMIYLERFMERRYDHECECFYLRACEIPRDTKLNVLVPEDGVGPEIFERQIGEDTYVAHVYVDGAIDLRVESVAYTLIKEEEVED